MAISSQPAAPPLHVVLALIEASLNLQRLWRLSAIWTATASLGDAHSEQDQQALTAMKDEISTLAGAVEGHAETFRRFFETHASWANAEITRALATADVSSQQVEDVRATLAEAGDDFAARGVALANDVFERAPREIRLGIDRGSVLLASDRSQPLISHDTACTAVGLITLAELALCPATSGVSCVLAIPLIVGLGAMGCH
jgi:hypothetical protein